MPATLQYYKLQWEKQLKDFDGMKKCISCRELIGVK
jgi:hypothetical protein